MLDKDYDHNLPVEKKMLAVSLKGFGANTPVLYNSDSGVTLQKTVLFKMVDVIQSISSLILCDLTRG
jgi:hypothetical protein